MGCGEVGKQGDVYELGDLKGVKSIDSFFLSLQITAYYLKIRLPEQLCFLM